MPVGMPNTTEFCSVARGYNGKRSRRPSGWQSMAIALTICVGLSIGRFRRAATRNLG